MTEKENTLKQLTLENIETKTCEKCKLGMKCESIIDNDVVYFCPTCLKEYRYTICINCFDMFNANGFKLCEQCRNQSLKMIVTDGECKTPDQILCSPSITTKVR